jgi:hypothetical protein
VCLRGSSKLLKVLSGRIWSLFLGAVQVLGMPRCAAVPAAVAYGCSTCWHNPLGVFSFVQAAASSQQC